MAAGALAACLAFPGFSQAQAQGQQGGVHGTQGAAGAAQQQRDPAAGYFQMHQADGTITQIEEKAGNVTIRLTNGQDVKLNLPAVALQQFDDGDKVTVRSQLTMAEARGQGAGTGTTGNTGSAGSTGGMGTGAKQGDAGR
jgi:hypothetical protein